MKRNYTLLMLMALLLLISTQSIAQPDIEIKSDGDVVFLSNTSSIVFPSTIGVSDPMIFMFASGVDNEPRMVIGHSPAYPTWGLEYEDTTDKFFFRNGSVRGITMDLGSRRLGIGTESPLYPLHLHATSGTNYMRISDVTTDESSGMRIGLNGLGSAYFINDFSTGTINFGTNGATDATLEVDGDMRFEKRVGAASTSPSFPIDVRDDVYDRAGYFYNTKSTANTTFGIFGGAYGAGAGDKRGGSFDAVNGSGTNTGVRGFAQNGTTNVGVYGYASGGTSNLAGHFAAGDVKMDNHAVIGGSNPSSAYVLYVRQDDNNTGGGYFYNTRNDASSSYGLVTYGYQTGTGNGYGIYTAGTTYAIYAAGNQYISGDLRVGSAADVPGYRLSVDGDAICEELKVQNSASWPDFVFEQEYALLPLDQLESQIAINGHLPGIPSSAEVEAAGGIEVGDMQKKLLQKVEELTLYVLQLNQKNNELQNEVDALKSQLNNNK